MTTDATEPFAAPAVPKRRLWVPVLFVCGMVTFMGILLLPAKRTAREAHRRAQCVNNLKSIGIGLMIYADAYGTYPPEYTVDVDGRRLHSWRSLIAPFMEGGQEFSKRVDFSRPWDAPENADARAFMSHTFACPSAGDIDKFHTTYLAAAGATGFFSGNEARLLADITDDVANTVLLIEVPATHAVHWMAPEDADEALFLSIGQESTGAHPKGFNVMYADGRVEHLFYDTPAEVRKALFSYAGGESVRLPDDVK